MEKFDVKPVWSITEIDGQVLDNPFLSLEFFGSKKCFSNIEFFFFMLFKMTSNFRLRLLANVTVILFSARRAFRGLWMSWSCQKALGTACGWIIIRTFTIRYNVFFNVLFPQAVYGCTYISAGILEIFRAGPITTDWWARHVVFMWPTAITAL